MFPEHRTIPEYTGKLTLAALHFYIVERWKAAHRQLRYNLNRDTNTVQTADHFYYGHDGGLYLEKCIRDFRVVSGGGSILTIPTNHARDNDMLDDILGRVQTYYETVITKPKGGKEIEGKCEPFTKRIGPWCTVSAPAGSSTMYTGTSGKKRHRDSETEPEPSERPTRRPRSRRQAAENASLAFKELYDESGEPLHNEWTFARGNATHEEVQSAGAQTMAGGDLSALEQNLPIETATDTQKANNASKLNESPATGNDRQALPTLPFRSKNNSQAAASSQEADLETQSLAIRMKR